jgi:alkanesulfonate monooxygenase SsuD/methylene tetrahydromethanopterin reductase-like flavin-dependent oxidoreductase (luciferase family)
MIRIGLSVSSSHHVKDPRVGANNMIARASAARDADLDTLFIGDHHVTPFPYYQNNIMLARMLAEWGGKPYGALYLLPLWHPVLLAEQVGTLASLAPGRFIMQCGLGDDRQGAAMGVDMSRKVGMFLASLRTMQDLWAGRAATEEKYWQVKDAVISPVPAEPVEVWVGAVVDQAMKRTARVADAWLASPGVSPAEAGDLLGRYLDYCEEAGRPPAARAIRRDIYVGATAEEAVKVAAPYIEKGYRGIPTDALMVGSVDQVAAQMQELADLGFTDVIVRNMSSEQKECMDCLERLKAVRALVGPV